MMTFSSLWQCWNNSLLSISLSFSQNIQQSCLVCLVLSRWLAIKSESLFQVHTVHMSLTLLRNFFLPILTPRVTWCAHPSQVISLESLPLLLWQKKASILLLFSLQPLPTVLTHPSVCYLLLLDLSSCLLSATIPTFLQCLALHGC